jgi:hypothetical protein
LRNITEDRNKSSFFQSLELGGKNLTHLCISICEKTVLITPPCLSDIYREVIKTICFA